MGFFSSNWVDLLCPPHKGGRTEEQKQMVVTFRKLPVDCGAFDRELP